MEIKEYLIKDLVAFTKSPEYISLKNVPVTPHRALSHARNPRADENDLALLVAYENNEVVSYVGALPDFIFIEEKPVKIAWGSTGWVNPEYKNTGIYVVLLMKAMEFYGNNFALAEVSESARKVFASSKQFIELKNLKSKTVICRSCMAETLSGRSKKLRAIAPVFKIFDSAVNAFLNPVYRNKIKSSGIREKIQSQKILSFDDESIDFIRQNDHENLCKRGKKELEWILENPWIRESGTPSPEDKKYFFSSSEKIFRMSAYKLFGQGQLIAVVIIKQRNNHISAPYTFYKKDQAKELIQFVFLNAFENKAAKVTVFTEALIKEINNIKATKLHVKDRERKSYITKKFSNMLKGDYTLQPGDGDTAFT